MAASPENATTAPGETFAPERQVASMLGLCEAQMDSALQESDLAVDELIKAFSSVVDATRTMSALAKRLPSEAQGALANEMEAQIAIISKHMSTAVIAFQFYDKLTQRLGHVRYSLSTLAMFVCDRAQMNQPAQWQRLLNTLRRLYRTEEERQIFRAIVDGAGDETVETRVLRALDEEPQAGEIELF